MDKKMVFLLSGAGVMVLALGIAIGVVAQRPVPASAVAAAPAKPKVAPRPDATVAARDILLKLNKAQGLHAEPWAGVDINPHGQPYLVWFIALQSLDAQGKPENCHSCEPQLAAVTYKQDAKGWSISAVDTNLGPFGSWGKPPQVPRIEAIALGSKLGLTFEDSDGGQGITHTFRGILSFDENWTYLGVVPVAGENSGDGDCVQDKAECYSWSGKLKVGTTTTNGVPDLVVDRQGTLWTPDAGIIPAVPITYAYTGSKYEEKSKVEAAAAAAAAKAALTISLSELRRMAATGMKTYKPYWVTTMINGYDNFGDQLCDSVRYDGYCEINRDSVRVEQDLQSADAQRKLYDARGRQGTALCAQVEMRPDGQVYLTDFSIGACR